MASVCASHTVACHIRGLMCLLGGISHALQRPSLRLPLQKSCQDWPAGQDQLSTNLRLLPTALYGIKSEAADMLGGWMPQGACAPLCLSVLQSGLRAEASPKTGQNHGQPSIEALARHCPRHKIRDRPQAWRPSVPWGPPGQRACGSLAAARGGAHTGPLPSPSTASNLTRSGPSPPTSTPKDIRCCATSLCCTQRITHRHWRDQVTFSSQPFSNRLQDPAAF